MWVLLLKKGWKTTSLKNSPAPFPGKWKGAHRQEGALGSHTWPWPWPRPQVWANHFFKPRGRTGKWNLASVFTGGPQASVHPREQKSFDFRACGEMARSPAGKARQGQVRRRPVNGYLLQEVLLHRLRQSTAPAVSLDTSCHPYPCSEAILAVDFNFCSEFISWASVGRPRSQRLSAWPHKELGEDAHPCLPRTLDSRAEQESADRERSSILLPRQGAWARFLVMAGRKVKEGIFNIKRLWEVKAAGYLQAGGSQPYSPQLS